MTCCYQCANWQSNSSRAVRSQNWKSWGDEIGTCSLYPDHRETKAAHYCGQYVPHREFTYDGRPLVIRLRDQLDDNWDIRTELEKEVERLRDVAKKLRRKLKEERAK